MRMLYKYPATKKTPTNYMHKDYFDFIVIEENEKESYLEDGWYLTTTEAKKSYSAESNIESNHPPTREELELKAIELGIGFSDKTRDSILLKKITKAIESEPK